MAKKKGSLLDSMPRKYDFMINPYPHMRISKCPICDKKTGQRKLPLMIHIDPAQIFSLNYTCRYCKRCDLLVAHKHEIEHYMTEMMRSANPKVIGNPYLIMGTVERKIWKENMENPKPPHEMIKHVAVFNSVYNELRVTQTGWFHESVEPGIEEPPPSTEWVKR